MNIHGIVIRVYDLRSAGIKGEVLSPFWPKLYMGHMPYLGHHVYHAVWKHADSSVSSSQLALGTVICAAANINLSSTLH